MTDTTAAPKKAKAPVPSPEFEKDLVAGSVTSLIKAAGATASKANEGGVVRFPVSSIRRIDGFNVRFETPSYRAHIDDLKASMKSEGYYADKPMAGFAAKEDDENVLFLTDGYTRLTAVEELIEECVAGFDDGLTIPVIIKPQTQNLEDLTVALVLGNEGRPLSVMEKATVVKRLVGLGLTNAQIMERLRMSDRYVLDMIVLAGAPAKVRNMVLQDKISATEAIKQLKKGGAKAAAKIEEGVKAAEAAGKTRATAKDVKAVAPPAPKKTGGLVDSSTTVRTGKTVDKLEYRFKVGEIVSADMIKPVARFRDMDWWNWVDESTKTDAVIEENIEILITITADQPVDQEAAAAADDIFDDETGAEDAAEGQNDPEATDTPEDAEEGPTEPESGTDGEAEDDGEL